MPVRPENRDRYPADWPEISRRIRHDRAGNRCECRGQMCGDGACLGPDGRCTAINRQPHPLTGAHVILTVAHLDHTPENVAEDNLVACCQRGHNRYDAAERARGRKARRNRGRE